MSDTQELCNPFPGPQPYRAADRYRFFGREALEKKLASQLLAHPSTTLFGPSGAGKSSLMQAGVIPRLQDAHDFQVVRVDTWPRGEPPLPWVVRAIFADLELGEPPRDKTSLEALDVAMSLAEHRSDHPILIYLDQIEQLLVADRAEVDTQALIAGIDQLARSPIQGLQIMLALREDYLGRFRDCARDRKRLLAHGFRLGPLTVGEMVKAVCRAAAEGTPSQRWDEEQIRGLMREVRTPGQHASDDAEVQAAYAQIVCRTLFQQRAEADSTRRPVHSSRPTSRRNRLPQPGPLGAMEAERILRGYLDATLDDLGPLADDAQRLLEDHLVTADGGRTLRTESELLRILPADKLKPILKTLENAAILHAEAHEDSHYFEIGHDWLARKVSEDREQREREHQQQQALLRERVEAEARLAKERGRRRLFAAVALSSVVLTAVAVTMGLWASEREKEAKAAGIEAIAARELADSKALEASDARLLAGARELKNEGQRVWAADLLSRVREPKAARGWVALASDVLSTITPEVTLRGHDRGLRTAVWSDDGKRVLTASTDKTARVWDAAGTGNPVVLAGHAGIVNTAAWSPDHQRVLTASEDGTARVWRADGTGYVELPGHTGPVTAAAFSPDGARVVTASEDGTARIWRADGTGQPVALKGHSGPVTVAVFHPDGSRVLTASEDGTARLWSAGGAGHSVVFKGHSDKILFAAPSPDGKRVVTTSRDATARVWDAWGKGKPIVLQGHDGDVIHAAWSADSMRVATASADGTARVWNADAKGKTVVLFGHDFAVLSVAFHPDGRYIATASRDKTTRIWPVEGGKPLVLGEHQAPVRAAVWSPDGTRVLTATDSEQTGRSPDNTARIWRPMALELLPREGRFFHSAFIGAGDNLVVSAYDDNTVRLWRLDGTGDPVSAFKKQEAWIASAALSPDGTRVVTASFDQTARVFSADGSKLAELKGHEAAVRAAAFSPDGSRVLTASDDKRALIHPADGRGAPIVLSGHTDALTSAAWSPDGARIVTTSLDGTARVWVADGSGTPPVVLAGHTGDIYSAAWSRSGKQIVTASEDGSARIWNADAGALTRRFDHNSPVLRAIWSPDGRRIATAPRNGGLHLWNAGGHDEPIVLDAAVHCIAMAFLDGGRKIVAIQADNTVRTWIIDPYALRRGLSTAVADCLPPEMRAIHLSEPMEEEAKKQYDACESAHGRAPFFTRGNTP